MSETFAILIIASVLVVAAICVVAATRSGSYKVARSLAIRSGPERPFPRVNNRRSFNT